MAKVLIQRSHPDPLKAYAVIYLGHSRECIVDDANHAWLVQYRWFAVKSAHCWYAVRKKTVDGKTFYIKMHREIAGTPKGLDCHHVNHNTLDNRRHNLRNMYPADHIQLHANNPLREFFSS